MADNRFPKWTSQFPQYLWSICSLDKRLRFFNIYYNKPETRVEDVKVAVVTELEGPGKLLGYRLMHKKIRQKYDLFVTRDQVHNMICDIDPEALAASGNIGWKRNKKKGDFTSFNIGHHNDEIAPEDSIIYGPSTSNQIERCWRELQEKLEKYFKSQLNWLRDQGLPLTEKQLAEVAVQSEFLDVPGDYLPVKVRTECGIIIDLQELKSSHCKNDFCI
eukprot:gene2327-2679_t